MTNKPKEAPPPEPGVVDVAQMIAEATGVDPRAMVYLGRKDPKDGKEKYLARYMPEVFDVELVREEWGGGDYRARIKSATGKWLGGSAPFSIDGEPRAKAPPPAVVPEPVAQLTRSQGADAPPMWLTALITAAGPVVAEFIRNRPAPVDPAEMVKAQAESMRTVVELIGLKRDMEPKGDFDKFLDAFKMGMTIGRQGADSGDSGMGAVAQAVTELAKLARTRAPEAPPAQPAEVSSPRPPEIGPPVHPIQQAVNILLPVAESGSDKAEAWADIVSEQVPGLELALREAVAQVGSIAALLDVSDPSIQRHRMFFARVIEFLLAPTDELDDPDDYGPDDGPPDVGPHAGAVVRELAGDDVEF